MSSHLAILSRAGIVQSEKQGRSVIYRAESEVVRQLIAFLEGVVGD